jgi:hypothetical protein
VADLPAPLKELQHLGVGFVSLTEPWIWQRPRAGPWLLYRPYSPRSNWRFCETGCALGWPTRGRTAKKLGRPITAGLRAEHVRKLHLAFASNDEIALRRQIGCTSVCRILEAKS